MLADKKITVGITGGIAAYKAAELVSWLHQQGADVHVAMTASACEFITPLTMKTLSGNPVAMAAGLTQLKLLKAHPEVYEHLKRRGAMLQAGLEEALKGTDEANQFLKIYALATAAELQRRQEAAGKPASKNSKVFPLKPALEYIHDHYMEPCDTSTLANLCHLSQTHFRRLFLSCMGSTPLQFVISTRIYQACVLLVNTNEPVLNIAQAVGMPSVSSFNRNFQQVMDMSPRQYRASTAHRSPRKGQILPFKGWTMPEK